MVARILIGILVAIGGYLMVWKTQFFLEALGTVDWAERNLGAGGSRMLYKLIGIVIILIGFLAITNLYDMVIGGIVASLFGRG